MGSWQQVLFSLSLTTVLLLLRQMVDATQIKFLDLSCAEQYRCPEVPDLYCRITINYDAECPLNVKDATTGIPSQPKEYKVFKTTRLMADGNCSSSLNISWIPPNNSGATTLTGFQLRVIMVSGPWQGMAECVTYDFKDTEWTQQIYEREIPFNFDCFNDLDPGTYNVTLRSLPLYKYGLTPSKTLFRVVTITGDECKPAPPPSNHRSRTTPGTTTPPGGIGEMESPDDSTSLSMPVWSMAATAVGSFCGLVLLLLSAGFLIWRKIQKMRNRGTITDNSRILPSDSQQEQNRPTSSWQDHDSMPSLPRGVEIVPPFYPCTSTGGSITSECTRCLWEEALRSLNPNIGSYSPEDVHVAGMTDFHDLCCPLYGMQPASIHAASTVDGEQQHDSGRGDSASTANGVQHHDSGRGDSASTANGVQHHDSDRGDSASVTVIDSGPLQL